MKLPARILNLEATIKEEYQGLKPKFAIRGDDHGLFTVDDSTGYLMLVSSPDREQRDLYELKIRLSMRTSNEREVPVLFYTLYVNDNLKETESKSNRPKDSS